MRIDRAKVTSEVETLRRLRQSRPFRSRLRQWGIPAVVVTLFLVGVSPWLGGQGAAAYDLTSYRPWLRLAMALVLVAVVIAIGDRYQRKAVRDPAAHADSLERELERYTGRGWVWRTLVVGVLIGAATLYT
jgi:membrane protein implicated in regulation of membrane protease activity